MAEPISIEELWNERADDAMVREANAPPTVPTGSYNIKVVKATPQVADARSPYDGRKVARVQATVLRDGRSGGSVFFDISWEERRDAKGNLDRPARLYGNVQKVVGGTNVAETLNNILLYPLNAYISEAFQKEENGVRKFVSASTSSEREALLKEGYIPRNYVLNIREAK